MEGLVLLTAGALFLFAKQISKERDMDKYQQLQQISSGINDPYKSPTPAPYVPHYANNRYLEEMIRHGVAPSGMSFGPLGIPNYYFPRPGGEGYYIAHTY